MPRSSFHKMFLSNEYRELAGQRNAVVIKLAFLLLLTLTALGFAIGGLAELKTRMDNPFIRWVDFPVSSKVENKRNDLESFLHGAIATEEYKLEDFSEWVRFRIVFHKREHLTTKSSLSEFTYEKVGRVITFGDDLYQEIISKKNGNFIHLNQQFFSGEEDGRPLTNVGVIVTADLLSSLGYSPKEFSSVQYLSIHTSEDNQVFIPLLGVVNFLPSKASFLAFPNLFNTLQSTDGRFLEMTRDNRYRGSPENAPARLYLLSDLADAQAGIAKALNAKFGNEYQWKIRKTEAFLIDAEESYFAYQIPRPDSLSYAELYEWAQEKIQDPNFSHYTFIDDQEEANETSLAEYYTFKFTDLEFIRNFQTALDEELKLTLPMEQVESGENFSRVASLTAILAFTLFTFGVLNILLYVGNILNNHIEKIRPHLGTFKAMGLPNSQLLRVYLWVVLKLLGVALLIGLPGAYLLGYLLNNQWLEIGFELFHPAIPLAIGLLLVLVVLLIRQGLMAAFSLTPGDLIYERE